MCEDYRADVRDMSNILICILPADVNGLYCGIDAVDHCKDTRWKTYD